MNNGIYKDIAKYYDLIYFDKDYEKDVDCLEEIFKQNGIKNILEVGCGTGNYTRILLNRGYKVIASDASEDMLKIAKKKCKCKLVQSDVRELAISKRFDTCIALFTPLGYMVKDSDMKLALNRVRNHLKRNGLFIFDVWNGEAVLKILPEIRVREAENEEIKVKRQAVPNLKLNKHMVEVDYTFKVLNKKDNSSCEISEKHPIRFYFPREIKRYLEDTDFELVKICPFLEWDKSLDDSVWTMSVVAKAI